MPDKEIKSIRIEIIQFLRETDDQQGIKLYKEVKKIESEDSIYKVNPHEVHSKEELLNALNTICKSITEPTLMTLHIDSHGCEDGIGIDGGDNFISWEELYAHLRPINEKLHNTLMLIMSVCIGAGMMTRLEPKKRAPYMAFIANTREITFKDAAKGFPEFYRTYRTALDFRTALKALNDSIGFSEPLPDGKHKTEFFAYSSKELFDQVMNPDRDPENFKKIALSQKYSDPTMTDEEKIAVARTMIINDAERFRPHFNFQDVIYETTLK